MKEKLRMLRARNSSAARSLVGGTLPFALLSVFLMRESEICRNKDDGKKT